MHKHQRQKVSSHEKQENKLSNYLLSVGKQPYTSLSQVQYKFLLQTIQEQMGADSSFANIPGNCRMSQKESFEFTSQTSPVLPQDFSQCSETEKKNNGSSNRFQYHKSDTKTFKKSPSTFCADTDDTSVREQASSDPTTYRESGSSFNNSNTQAQNISKLDISDFKIHGVIGDGSSAEIFVASFKGSQQTQKQHHLAIKVIKKKNLTKSQQIESLKFQQQILNLCNSQFIPKLYGTFSDDDHYYIAMEFAEGGDCYSLIKEDSKRRSLFQSTGENGLRFLVGCVILGLEELHSKNILYGDLKPENVLLFEDGYAKLTDFGISKKLKPHEKTYLRSGSHLYLAPQFVNEQECGLEYDLWSLGILIYELANMTTPFDSDTIMYLRSFLRNAKAFEDGKEWHNSKVSDNLKDLVHGLLKIDPNNRLGARGWQQVKEHAFFKAQGFDWQQIKNKKIASPLVSVLKQKIRRKPLKPVSILPKLNKLQKQF